MPLIGHRLKEIEMNYTTMSPNDFIKMRGIEYAINILSQQKPWSDYFYVIDGLNEYRVSFSLLRKIIGETK